MFVGACTMPTSVSLRELRPSLELYGGGETLIGEMTFGITDGPYCAVFDDSFRATVNGAPLVIDYPWVNASEYCLELDYKLDFSLEDVPPSVPGTLVIADDSITITGDLGDIYVPTAMTIETPQPITRGSQVALRWSPASDFAKYTARVVITQGEGQIWTTEDLTFDGDRITFTLPVDGPPLGDDVLEVSMYTDRDSVPCVNATCKAHPGHVAFAALSLR